MLDCTRCKGKGKGWRDQPCPFCYGQGKFPEVNKTAIVGLVFNMGGRRAHGQFRAVFPTKMRRENGVIGNRAYYVWRMARFHGGADIRMPILSGLLAEGDPYISVLDAMADEIAKSVFGTDMAAAEKWHGTLY